VNTASFVYSNLKKNIHSNITFSKASGTKRTNVNGKLLRPISRTKSGKKRISCYAVNIFNSINDNVKYLPHVHAFKWTLKCSIWNEEFIESCLNGQYMKKYINA
jgi:hypothetical protein